MSSTSVFMFVKFVKTLNILFVANFSQKQARIQSCQYVIRMTKCVMPGRSSRAPSVQPAASEDPDELGWEIMDVDSENEFTEAKAEISTGSSGPPQPASGRTSARKKPSSSGSSAAVEATAKATPRPRRTKAQIYEQLKENQINALKCSPAAFQWGRFLLKIAANRKWSSIAFATKMSRRIRGSWNVDTGKPRGFGGRWGWREIGVF